MPKKYIVARDLGCHPLLNSVTYGWCRYLKTGYHLCAHKVYLTVHHSSYKDLHVFGWQFTNRQTLSFLQFTLAT